MTRRSIKLHSSKRFARRRIPRSLISENGSAPVDFLVVVIGSSAFTIIALSLCFAGFLRVKATDALADAARFAMTADMASSPVESSLSVVRERFCATIGEWPVRIRLTDLRVEDWWTASENRGIAVRARFAVPGFEWLGASQQVSVHAASELN